MNKAKFIIRSTHLINHQMKDTHWPAFITLTYEKSDLWDSRQISGFLQHCRKYIRYRLPNSSMPYVWRAEIQPKRFYRTGQAVIHYHLVVWVPIGIKLPKPDEQGWWPYGWSNIQKAYSPAGYLAKYINKPSIADLPKGARSYSVQSAGNLILDFLRIPNWLKYYSRFGDKVRRLKGKGWYVERTGLCYSSPWCFTSSGIKWIGFKKSSEWPDFYGFSNYRFAIVTHLETGAPF